ncbi:hypothetical protein [Kitasatospora sp. NPDC088351]|uniref:hypothetical protein n=1 Tax=Kitasatospora sp. NPDC088351 TaxID=3155180 RepID=UPI0034172B49
MHGNRLADKAHDTICCTSDLTWSSCRSGPTRTRCSRESRINTVIRRRTRRAVLAASVTATVLAGGLTACGTVKELNAADKVSKAFQKIGDRKAFKAELSVQASADQLIAFGKAVEDPIEPDTARAVSDLTLSVSMSADKPLKDVGALKKGSAETNSTADFQGLDLAYVLASKKGQTYADVRVVDSKFYLKVDIKGIAELAGEDATAVTRFAAELPPEAKVIKDVVDGKWVSLDTKQLEQFGKDAQKGAGSAARPSAAPTLDEQTSRNLINSVKDVLTKNVSFEDKGKQDGADRIRVSAPTRGLLDGLLQAVRPLAKDLPQLSPLPSTLPSDVPDRQIGVDLAIKNGAISSATFDLAQLTEKAGPDVHLPVRLSLSDDVEALKAPSGATEITDADFKSFGELLTAQVLGAGAGAGAGTGAGAGAGAGSTPAAPLTDAQLGELAAAGMDAEQAKAMNKLGFSFEELKELAAV